MKIKILQKSSHRNGISGDPFDVYLFQDEDGTTKLAVDFGESSFAVLQVDKLADGDIAFGSNSWRGDHFLGPIRKLAKKMPDEYSKGSFFVKYGIQSKP